MRKRCRYWRTFWSSEWTRRQRWTLLRLSAGEGQVEEETFDPKILAGLKEMGLKVEVVSSRDAAVSRGYWAGAWIDPVTRHIKGGATQGAEGQVAGY
jgi:hypothetical protein